MVMFGQEQGTYVIAEAGVNHNGSLDLALRLVDAARDSGADAVKFQAFKTESLVTADAPKAAYQAVTTGAGTSQYQMLKALELPPEALERVRRHCDEVGIDFLCSAFDHGSLDFLVTGMGQQRIKLGSGELCDAPLLLAAARAGVEIIASSGMATLADVEMALGVLAFGYLHPQEAPGDASVFRRALMDPAGRAALASKVALLHCTSNYPAAVDTANLRAMLTLRDAFPLACIGYSDHTEGTLVPVMAVTLGARIIEKHLTLDRGMSGPDHAASFNPAQFAGLVREIRMAEAALGDGYKFPAASEMDTRNVAHKSLVAAEDIAKGSAFSPRNVAVKRPGTGLSPHLYWDLLGRAADRDYRAGDLIATLP